MKAAEIVKRCQIELGDMPGWEKLIAAVLTWLSQEHLARQMLARLPSVGGDPWLLQLNLLFANLYSECAKTISAEQRGTRWQLLYEQVVKLSALQPQFSNNHPWPISASSAGKTTPRELYLQQMRQCLHQLVTAMVAEPMLTDSEPSDTAACDSTDHLSYLSDKLPEPVFLLYSELMQTFVEGEGVAVSKGESARNQRLVKEWWYGLETLPALAGGLQQKLFTTLLSCPFAVSDEQLERMERLFLTTPLSLLSMTQQEQLVTDTPLLVLDVQASENLIWLLSENGFATSGQSEALQHFWGHLDMLRCVMPLGVEALHAVSCALSDTASPRESAFWGLLDLSTLTQAARLAVGAADVPAKQAARSKSGSTPIVTSSSVTSSSVPSSRMTKATQPKATHRPEAILP